MVLLGVSFAWYSAGNTSVSANNLTVIAAEPNVSPLDFKYVDGDMAVQNLYLASGVHQLADEYGRLKYTGETADATYTQYQETIDGVKVTYNDYRYTLYYVIDIANSSQEVISAQLSIESNTIYKLLKEDATTKWNTFQIGTVTYTISADNTITGTDNATGTYTVGTATDGYDGKAVVGTSTYYFIGGIVYQLDTGLPMDGGQYSDSLNAVGHYGAEKVSGDVSNYQLLLWKYEDVTGIVDYTLPAGFEETSPLADNTVTIPANSTGVKYIVGIRYQKTGGGFDYSSTDYMGAYFNFSLDLMTEETQG